MYKSVEEFYVKTLEIGGIGAALQALRLPYGKECRSAVDFTAATFTPVCEPGEGYYDGIKLTSSVLVHEKDSKLLSTLVKRGDEHAKVLRGIHVWCEVNAPRYWHFEADTYSVGASRLSSTSTMHIECQGLSEDELIEMKENLKESHMQKRVWDYSYQTLRRIYFQRRNHRLPQWRKFCEWIESLPFAKEFITIENPQ